VEEQCLMTGPSVSDLGFLHCLSECNIFDPNFGLCRFFCLKIWTITPTNVRLWECNIRPPFDFDLPLQTVIWMIVLSMRVTKSFLSVPLHLRNAFCALVYVGRGKKYDHIGHLKQACSTSQVV
jgi:hypothetical protein